MPPSAYEIQTRKKAKHTGLPRICSSKVCRRTKMCAQESQHCMLDHMILHARRLNLQSRRKSRRKSWPN